MQFDIRSIPRLVTAAGVLAVLSVLAACARQDTTEQAPDGRDWISYGRTFDESHFSPLTQIDASNVQRLGLAWALDLDVHNSVTSPLAVDGVIYLAAGYSIVHAVDAKSGRLLWKYDPEVARVAGISLRTGWGIRGLAYWDGKLYVGTQDGRLIAVDAGSGKLLWSAQTFDPSSGLFIPGPPRAFNGKVVIGNAGGDFSAVRGFVTAYDAGTGRQLWRFYMVPGEPGKPDGTVSDDMMEAAAKTWSGEWWKHGGGGNVWNAITYDPDFNRVYLGTGNALPWNWKIRSPQGGDNLFTASVVALDADTGKYAWHYQTTPGDAWDYDSSTDLQTTTLALDGKPRKVLLHASKNGFFYVIDRETGKPVSAEKFGKVTWAERIDLSTGRPVEAPNARYQDGPIDLWPSFLGMRAWWPSAYSEATGLVYMPTTEMGGGFSDAGIDVVNWKPIPHTPTYSGMPQGHGDVPAGAGASALLAWNPLTQQAAWRVPTPGAVNGGVMATAGNLVFQGHADGQLNAYSADKGEKLWSFFAGTAVIGTPITYSVDGKQYVTITAGPMTGTAGAFGTLSAQFGWDARVHPRRLLTFVLDGKAALPPTPPPFHVTPLQAPEFVIDEAAAKAGGENYLRCTICHGSGAIAGGAAPDLRASTMVLSREAFDQVVRSGTLEARGMPKFPELTDEELDSLRHYIRARARTAPGQ